jgi:hypothetical protein
MSQSEVERLIGRAMLDAEFRQRLLEYPKATLQNENFDLTPEEIVTLEGIPPATVRCLARCLNRRLAQVGWWPYSLTSQEPDD